VKIISEIPELEPEKKPHDDQAAKDAEIQPLGHALPFSDADRFFQQTDARGGCLADTSFRIRELGL
jgi:hypothetical protein